MVHSRFTLVQLRSKLLYYVIKKVGASKVLVYCRDVCTHVPWVDICVGGFFGCGCFTARTVFMGGLRITHTRTYTHTHTHTHSLSHFLCLSLQTHTHSLFLCLSLSVCVSLCPSFSLSFCLSVLYLMLWPSPSPCEAVGAECPFPVVLPPTVPFDHRVPFHSCMPSCVLPQLIRICPSCQ